jgi:transcriptional regulator with XRE-family HTH domain
MQSLAHFIEKRKLTIEEFAGLVGVGRVHASRLIHGTRHPSLKLLKRLADTTGVPVEKLLNEALDAH